MTDDDLYALTEDWFTSLSASRLADDSLTQVLHIAQQPFKDLRLPALRLVGAVAALPWGEQLLIGHPGFVEYLLDRSTEREDRGGLEAKYHVVQTLVQSTTSGSGMGVELYQRLREYEREGPLYVRIETQVAFDTGQ